MGKKYNYSKYATPKSEPKCVKYWDREFVATELWINWTVLKTMLSEKIPSIMDEADVGKKEATNILWTAFIEATCGEEGNPCTEDYKAFCKGLNPYTWAYFTPRLTVGSDIHDGFTEKQALKRYQNWLAADPKNPIFGKYKVLPDLQVVEIKKKQSRRKKK